MHVKVEGKTKKYEFRCAYPWIFIARQIKTFCRQHWMCGGEMRNTREDPALALVAAGAGFGPLHILLIFVLMTKRSNWLNWPFDTFLSV